MNNFIKTVHYKVTFREYVKFFLDKKRHFLVVKRVQGKQYLAPTFPRISCIENCIEKDFLRYHVHWLWNINFEKNAFKVNKKVSKEFFFVTQTKLSIPAPWRRSSSCWFLTLRRVLTSLVVSFAPFLALSIRVASNSFMSTRTKSNPQLTHKI